METKDAVIVRFKTSCVVGITGRVAKAQVASFLCRTHYLQALIDNGLAEELNRQGDVLVPVESVPTAGQEITGIVSVSC